VLTSDAIRQDPRAVGRDVLAIVSALVDELGGRSGDRPVGLDDRLDRDLGIGSLERVELLLRLERETEMISDRPERRVLLTTLGRNWWMVGARAALAVLFGVLLLLRPTIPLDRVVALFGVYAALDGAWAIASALWVTRKPFAGWPVLLEGAVSLVVGVLALVWPVVPRQLVAAIAIWGLLTGVLEIVAAALLPRQGAGYWLLATGGVFSLFLALLIIMLPHASQPYVVCALGIYALAFGALLAAAAVSLRKTLRAR
jgi:uncharacterized membrane protein HdeD (DUF308 family)